MMKYVLLILSALFLYSSSAMADEKGSFTLQSIAEKEIYAVNEKGEPELKRVNVKEIKVLPGDEVIYTTKYNHVGKEPAENIVITNAIPEHTIYTDLSAEGKGTKIIFSVDGGKAYELPENLWIKQANGRERSPKSSDYTNIRWIIKKLNPGETGNVSFRVRVE